MVARHAAGGALQGGRPQLQPGLLGGLDGGLELGAACVVEDAAKVRSSWSRAIS